MGAILTEVERSVGIFWFALLMAQVEEHSVIQLLAIGTSYFEKHRSVSFVNP